MRLVIALSTSLMIGAAASALAHDPATPAQPSAAQTQQSPTSGNQPATPATTSAVSNASSSSTAAPATQPPTTQPAGASTAPSAAKPGELTGEEKALLAQGYKMETHHGEHVFCRKETETGSRFPQKTCATAAQLSANRANDEKFTRDAERFQNATTPLAGGH